MTPAAVEPGRGVRHLVTGLRTPTLPFWWCGRPLGLDSWSEPVVWSRGMTDDSAAGWFELYDLKVEVVAPPDAKIWCGARVGDHFTLEGEMLRLPPGQGFSIYSISAVVPFLAAKQRVTDPNDWMTTDAEIACPDPNCPSRLRITRTGRRRFRHADTTAVSRPDAP